MLPLLVDFRRPTTPQPPIHGSYALRFHANHIARCPVSQEADQGQKVKWPMSGFQMLAREKNAVFDIVEVLERLAKVLLSDPSGTVPHHGRRNVNGLETGVLGADTPIEVFKPQEKRLVQQTDLSHKLRFHQQGAAGCERNLTDPIVLAVVSAVKTEVLGKTPSPLVRAAGIPNAV